MKEFRLVNLDSLLEKQYSPLHTKPVISVADVHKEHVIKVTMTSCHDCHRQIFSDSKYKYCPYCGADLKEVSN